MENDHVPELNDLERRLLNEYQHDFPISMTPFADIAQDLGIDEREVLDALASLESRGMVSRVGPVLRPNRVGRSTLAAISVPESRLAEVARFVNAYPEVNHNYEREHEFNLWFVVTARDRDRINEILAEIHRRTGLQVLDLPMEEAYHIDLGFPLWC